MDNIQVSPNYDDPVTSEQTSSNVSDTGKPTALGDDNGNFEVYDSVTTTDSSYCVSCSNVAWSRFCTSCIDTQDSTLCTNCTDCTFCVMCVDCHNCKNATRCINCTNCTNCVGCVGCTPTSNCGCQTYLKSTAPATDVGNKSKTTPN